MAKRKRSAPVRRSNSSDPGLEHLGSWAFIVGVVLAVLLGLWAALGGGSLGGVVPWAGVLLVLLGLVVGLLNVMHHEASHFLWAGTALLLVVWLAQSSQGVFSGVWGASVLEAVLGALIAFVMPALVVLSLRAICNSARHP